MKKLKAFEDFTSINESEDYDAIRGRINYNKMSAKELSDLMDSAERVMKAEWSGRLWNKAFDVKAKASYAIMLLSTKKSEIKQHIKDLKGKLSVPHGTRKEYELVQKTIDQLKAKLNEGFEDFLNESSDAKSAMKSGALKRAIEEAMRLLDIQISDYKVESSGNFTTAIINRQKGSYGKWPMVMSIEITYGNTTPKQMEIQFRQEVKTKKETFYAVENLGKIKLKNGEFNRLTSRFS